MLLVYSIKNVGISYDYQKTLLHHIIPYYIRIVPKHINHKLPVNECLQQLQVLGICVKQ